MYISRSNRARGVSVLALLLVPTLLATTTTAAAPRDARRTEPAEPAFLSWAATPPMGWNSWDCFATTVTEAQTKAQTDEMADSPREVRVAVHRRRHPVVRARTPRATNIAPAPSSPWTNGDASCRRPTAFRPLRRARDSWRSPKYVHDKGLKFGVHLHARDSSAGRGSGTRRSRAPRTTPPTSRRPTTSARGTATCTAST